MRPQDATSGSQTRFRFARTAALGAPILALVLFRFFAGGWRFALFFVSLLSLFAFLVAIYRPTDSSTVDRKHA